MKALLICPSIRPAVPQLAENGPLATAPVLGGCVASHWIEHLAVLGAREVTLIAADRPDQVEADLGNGSRWGVDIKVLAVGSEPSPGEAAARYRQEGDAMWLPAPHDVVLMSHLPGCAELPLFESYASWFAALRAWMPRAVTPARIRMSEIRPGIWAGHRAHVSSTAELIAPCWIGDQVFVEPGAIVGPDAILEDRSVVEAEARVTQSWVGPDTFVGPMTSVASSLAWGSSLTNWLSESSLRVPDPFLLCSLAPPTAPHPIKQIVREAETPIRQLGLPPDWIARWPLPVRRGRHSPHAL